MSTSTTALALARVTVQPLPSVPASVRHAWHRVSMLGTLVVLLVLPWLTSTGCSGDRPPVTSSGYELMALTFAGEPLFVLAPLALLLSTLLLIAAPRVVSAGRRAWLSALMFLLALGGSFFLLVAIEGPRGGETVEHHFASFAGSGALIAIVLEALVRLVLGVREWWLARRARRASIAPHFTRDTGSAERGAAERAHVTHFSHGHGADAAAQ